MAVFAGAGEEAARPGSAWSGPGRSRTTSRWPNKTLKAAGATIAVVRRKLSPPPTFSYEVRGLARRGRPWSPGDHRPHLPACDNRAGLEALSGLRRLADGHTVMPRVSRARSMDIYPARRPSPLPGRDRCHHQFATMPMMMTAAGTRCSGADVHHQHRHRRRPGRHRPARLALSAIISTTSIVPRRRQRLRWRRVHHHEDEDTTASTTAYAKPVSSQSRRSSRAGGQTHIQTQDIVVTT